MDAALRQEPERARASFGALGRACERYAVRHALAWARGDVAQAMAARWLAIHCAIQAERIARAAARST
jgi:hypothetical protein